MEIVKPQFCVGTTGLPDMYEYTDTRDHWSMLLMSINQDSTQILKEPDYKMTVSYRFSEYVEFQNIETS